MSDPIQVLTTAGSKEEAERLAEVMVEQRLAGCAQVVGPIQSTYWWEGKVERAEEWLCLFKTTARLYEPLEAALRAAHSYDVPEILALPVLRGNADYLAWLADELKP